MVNPKLVYAVVVDGTGEVIFTTPSFRRARSLYAVIPQFLQKCYSVWQFEAVKSLTIPKKEYTK